MIVATFSFDLASKKWSIPALPTNLDSERTLVVCFGPPSMDEDLSSFAELSRAFPRSHVIGCSSSGGLEGKALRDNALVVTVIQFTNTTMSSAQALANATTDAFAAGQALAKRLSKPSLRGLLVFGDGVEVNGPELVRGLNSALDQSVAVIGGLAADGGAFKRTWVLSGSNVKSGMVAAVGLYGEHLSIALSTQSGWSPLGSELVVSRADGRVIYELDGKPALTVLEERAATGKNGSGLLMMPFAVRASARHDKFLVRSVVSVDLQKKSIRLAGEIPQGYLAQPLTASPDSLLASAREAAAHTKDSAAPVGKDAVVLVVSHAGRRGVLGDRAAEEIAAAIGALPAGPTAHPLGFFGHGEIAPLLVGHSDLHNQSLTVAMLMESPTPIARKAARGLAAGAARAQAPASSAGPAAHLRARNQTVDDLFLELEVEGGKSGLRNASRPTGGTAPPLPSKRPPLPTPPASKPALKNGAVANSNHPSLAATEEEEEETAPSFSLASAALAGPGRPLGPTPNSGIEAIRPEAKAPATGAVAVTAAARATAATGAPVGGTGTKQMPAPVLSAPLVPHAAAPAPTSSSPLAAVAVVPTPAPPSQSPRSRMKTPRVIDVDASVLAAPVKPRMSVSTFAHDSEHGAWSVATLPAIDSPQTLVLAFGVPALGGTAGPLEELAKAYPTSSVLGCASTRLIRGSAPDDGNLVVSTARFTHTALLTAWADVSIGSAAAGASLAQSLTRPDLRAVFVLADSSVDADAFQQALTANLPTGVIITGGVAAAESGRSWIMCGGTIRSGIVAAVGFYGSHLAVHTETRTDFEVFGPERVITRSAGTTVYEIDGKRALGVYAELLGSPLGNVKSSALPFPLAVQDPSSDALRARMPVGFDTSAESITFAADMPQNATVRFMRANPDRLVDETVRAAAATRLGSIAGSAALVLAVSSLGRAQALGGRADEENEAILEGIPSDGHTTVTGFYSLAELGGASAGLSNDSLSLTIFSESEAPLSKVDPISERRTIPVPPNPAETPSPVQVSARPSQPARRRPEVTRPLLSGGAVPTGASAPTKVTKEKHGELLLVTFSGRLSESFKGDSIGRELSGTVVFDLGGIERITSFGVREWLNMLAAAQGRVKKMYFAHCSEAVVNQLSMIRKFAGNAQVVSMFAPYLCDSCGEEFERLFDCDLDADALRSNTPPESVCRRCGGKGRFDDDAETYFTFAPSHLGQPVPPDVRALLLQLDAVQPAAAADAIDKSVEGEITRVRVSTKLASNVRWQRVLDGIEGSLVIDLGGVGAIDDAGVSNFENALSSLSSDVESVRLDRTPQGVVEHFAQSGLPRRVIIASALVTGFCPSCNVQRPALLVVDDHAHNLAAGKPPALSCKRCNGRLQLVDAADLLSFLSRQRKRTSVAPRASLPATPPAMAAAIAVPALPPAPAMPTALSVAPPPAASAGGRGIIAAAAILSVAILCSAAFFAYARSRTTTPAEETVKPAPTVAISSLTDLPPPWVERPFVEENGFLLIVGRCDRAATAEAALGQARNEAVSRIVKQAYGDLAGSPVYDFLAGRFNEEDARKRRDSVAERYLRQVGSIGTPDRGETVVRQREGGVEAFARYRLSRAAYMQVLALYKATAQFQGMTVARAFPLLDVGKSDADLVVINVTKGRPAESAGATIGDLVTSMNGRPVATPEAVSKAGDDWNALPNGGSYDVGVENGGNKSTLKIVKKVFAAAPPPPVVAPQPPQPPASKATRDLGIIPPARRF